MKPIYKALMLVGISLAASTSYARCILGSPRITDTTDTGATGINYGTINVASPYLQPAGSVIAHTVIQSPTLPNATNPDQALWTCDKADLPDIYFMVATNGDEPWGGHIDIGGPDGLSDVYATWWQYVGVKHQMRDVVFTRYWKRLDIETYGERADGRIDIRIRDIPPLEVTLYRVSSTVPTSPRGSFCGYNGQIVRGNYRGGYRQGSNTAYVCNQPSAYVQLGGNSNVAFGFNHDVLGSDSNANYLFWGAWNGFGYGFYNSTTNLTQAETCVARNATPIVNFGTVAAPDLNRGIPARANLNVEIECSNTAVSGVNADQVAIGFLPSNAALANAQTLGVLNANGSSDYLVADDYFADNSAKGVGIQLRNPSTNTEMKFLGASASSSTGGGQAVGWYPALEGSPTVIGSITGYTKYSQHYEAALRKLPNTDIKSGTVKATATVLVKVQ